MHSGHRSLLLFVCVAGAGLEPPLIAIADPVPTIATYELRRQREDRVAEKRDPRAFWARQIVLRIEDKRPPRTTMPAGRTIVHFVVGRDGTIVSEAVATSSGRPDVDRLALEMVGRAAPFPPMPPGLTDDSMTFDLPLRFR